MNNLWSVQLFVSGKFIALLFLVIGCSARLSAQEIQINEDPRISQLCRTWINDNRANPRIEGWRVQVMASTDRLQVEDARNKFRIAHPDVPAEWIHEKPYYKLRIGAFRNKLEAMAFIATLADYTGAYPAKDANIHPRDFLE
ncbi:MAG: SPOR domain-containing protein [Lewinellaceae bacterium]|nr:SPOR domain-containing protein [Lewinellaceae bacterium]